MKSDNMAVNQGQEEIIRKDNKKAKKSFIIFMLISFIAGGIFGFFSIKIGTKISVITEAFQGFMMDNAGMLSIILAAIMAIATAAVSVWCILGIKHSKKKAIELMEKGDDTELEKVEKKLSYDVFMANGLVIFQFLYFSVMVFIFTNFLASREKIGYLICAIVIFITGILTILLIQQRQVDCIRFMNPEKRGSVYDINFNKKWEKSCDEAELFIIYRATYKAHRAVNILYMVFWVFFTIMGLSTGIGFLPILTVIILWVVSTMVYSYYAIKQ